MPFGDSSAGGVGSVSWKVSTSIGSGASAAAEVASPGDGDLTTEVEGRLRVDTLVPESPVCRLRFLVLVLDATETGGLVSIGLDTAEVSATPFSVGIS